MSSVSILAGKFEVYFEPIRTMDFDRVTKLTKSHTSPHPSKRFQGLIGSKKLIFFPPKIAVAFLLMGYRLSSSGVKRPEHDVDPSSLIATTLTMGRAIPLPPLTVC
jgi:hypothetical protein